MRPENALATAAGLEVGPRGGIRVNEHMQTSDPDVYAVGDAVEVREFITGDPIQIPLAGPANRQGRIAADHIFAGDCPHFASTTEDIANSPNQVPAQRREMGTVPLAPGFARPTTYRGTQGTAVVGVFGMTAAMTGLSEKVLHRVGRAYEKIYLHPTDHASYYPGAERMSLKLLFDPADGKILGAQAVGTAGVDKRIDVLAIAIQAGMTVFDLEEAELAYAPQFGSAKDPINMAGFIAANVVRGDVRIVQAAQLPQVTSDGATLVDVRTPAEFARGHVPGAINVPLDELRERLNEIEAGKPVVAYCELGQRGYLATRILTQAGYDAANLSGGYTTYCQANGVQH